MQARLQRICLELLQLGIHLAPQRQVELAGTVVVRCLLLWCQHGSALLSQRTAGSVRCERQAVSTLGLHRHAAATRAVDGWRRWKAGAGGGAAIGGRRDLAHLSIVSKPSAQ